MSILTGQMQQRRGTAAAWTAANPTLLAGEIGFETDTNRAKFGTGALWNATAYISSGALTSGLTSGGAISIITGTTARIAAATWYIVGFGNFTILTDTDFLLSLSSAGNQRFVGFYGNTSGTVTKVEGTEGSLATYPAQPADTALIGYVLVTDGAVGTTPDLSGYMLISSKATQSTVLIGTNDTTYITPLANARDLKRVARDYTNSSPITGTVAETKLGTGLEIPANTMGVGDVLSIRTAVGQVSASGSATLRIYIHTADQLSGATLIGLYSAAGLRIPILRHLWVESATSTSYLWPQESLISDIVSLAGNANSAPKVSSNINWAVKQYIIVSFAPSTAGATSTRHYLDAIKQ